MQVSKKKQNWTYSCKFPGEHVTEHDSTLASNKCNVFKLEEIGQCKTLHLLMYCMPQLHCRTNSMDAEQYTHACQVGFFLRVQACSLRPSALLLSDCEPDHSRMFITLAGPVGYWCRNCVRIHLHLFELMQKLTAQPHKCSHHITSTMEAVRQLNVTKVVNDIM